MKSSKFVIKIKLWKLYYGGALLLNIAGERMSMLLSSLCKSKAQPKTSNWNSKTIIYGPWMYGFKSDYTRSTSDHLWCTTRINMWKSLTKTTLFSKSLIISCFLIFQVHSFVSNYEIIWNSTSEFILDRLLPLMPHFYCLIMLCVIVRAPFVNCYR